MASGNSRNGRGKKTIVVDYEEYIYYDKPLSEVEYVDYYEGYCRGFYSINPNGLLWKKAVWDSSRVKKYIKYEYDEWGKVSKITYPDQGSVEYDWAGQLFGGFVEQITDYRDVNDRPGDYGSSFKYNYYYPLNKIKSYTDCNGYTVNYDYSFAYGQKTHIDINNLSDKPKYPPRESASSVQPEPFWRSQFVYKQRIFANDTKFIRRCCLI
jgi:hypothetical protein